MESGCWHWAVHKAFVKPCIVCTAQARSVHISSDQLGSSQISSGHSRLSQSVSEPVYQPEKASRQSAMWPVSQSNRYSVIQPPSVSPGRVRSAHTRSEVSPGQASPSPVNSRETETQLLGRFRPSVPQSISSSSVEPAVNHPFCHLINESVKEYVSDRAIQSVQAVGENTRPSVGHAVSHSSKSKRANPSCGPKLSP